MVCNLAVRPDDGRCVLNQLMAKLSSDVPATRSLHAVSRTGREPGLINLRGSKPNSNPLLFSIRDF
jgi:hypothetical protein